MKPTAAQLLMIADGLPAAAILSSEERSQMWGFRSCIQPLAKEQIMKNKAKIEARARVSAALGRPLTPAKARSAKKVPAKARAATTSAPTVAKGVRPGSKLETIVWLLKRPQGCTTADVLKATDWPTVSMPQQAKAAGLTLRKEKKEGMTVYFAV